MFHVVPFALRVPPKKPHFPSPFPVAHILHEKLPSALRFLVRAAQFFFCISCTCDSKSSLSCSTEDMIPGELTIRIPKADEQFAFFSLEGVIEPNESIREADPLWGL
mmetsp:Transcript_12439/g.20040  ORF Transcript_12439/g.20040 Transcript_12439/m.20040 type:complete len:107 (-) Transcript_12439:797-1117(-)